MGQLVWKSEYATGVTSLDYEHALLIHTVNAACSNIEKADCRDVAVEFLAQLYERMTAHFALEERLMMEKRFSQFKSHKASHEELLDWMREMMDAFEEGRCETCDKSPSECLQSWYSHHFLTEDSHLHALAR